LDLRNLIVKGGFVQMCIDTKKPKELHGATGSNLQNCNNSSPSSSLPWVADREVLAVGGAGDSGV
jgi:hypothetical protein